ncbi:MAG TPA: ABC transporter ATP-binding protein [Eubacterium sp.]|nr:ABC transporter ATP-binding protein [Eubacterium sp.]
MLEIKDLSVKLGKSLIIDNLSMNLNKGVYGLLGPNGAGKTTLIRSITGVYPVKNGTVMCDGELVGTKSYYKNLGYLPQNFGLYKDMMVYDMLMFMAASKYDKESSASADVIKALETVNLSHKKNSKIRTLSGGMVRRLGIANALLGNPKLLIFDEPTAGLDPEERLRFRDLIKEIGKDRMIIISTHIVSDIEDTSDHVIVFNAGRVLFMGSCAELEKRGEDFTETSGSLLERGYICTLRNA